MYSKRIALNVYQNMLITKCKHDYTVDNTEIFHEGSQF